MSNNEGPWHSIYRGICPFVINKGNECSPQKCPKGEKGCTEYRRIQETGWKPPVFEPAPKPTKSHLQQARDVVFGYGSREVAHVIYEMEKEQVLEAAKHRDQDAYEFFSKRMDAAHKFWMALEDIEEEDKRRRENAPQFHDDYIPEMGRAEGCDPDKHRMR